MKFLVEIDITPDCAQCKHAVFSRRLESDTIYCKKNGKKEIAVEPCDDFFIYNFLKDEAIIKCNSSRIHAT